MGKRKRISNHDNVVLYHNTVPSKLSTKYQFNKQIKEMRKKITNSYIVHTAHSDRNGLNTLELPNI